MTGINQRYMDDHLPNHLDEKIEHHNTHRRKRRRAISWLGLVTCLIFATAYYFPSQIRQKLVATDRKWPATSQNELQGPSVAIPSLTLKHIYHHNTDRTERTHGRLDITPSWLMAASLIKRSTMVDGSSSHLEPLVWNKQYGVNTRAKHIRRMKHRDPDTVEAYLEFTRSPISRNIKVDFDWIDDPVLVPDVTHRGTILTLASMASDAYVDIPFTGDWTNVSDPWNESLGMGWMEDGVRGHVFTDQDSSIAVIAIKGTSAAIFDSGGDTAPKDKVNDNLLFSCCCARISYLWNTVCDCYTGDSYTCDVECLEHQLYNEDRYYKAVLDIYRNVTAMYPDANIWVTGHSLGGSLAALLGRTYGVPAVGFEAPGELLATRRLHLPQPPGVPRWDDHIWHFGHTADPVFMGVCNGAGSACWIAGYAMETQCHSGLQCVYDVVEDKGWHVSMVNHRIHVVIDDVIRGYNTTPECKVAPPCQDCFNWKFILPKPTSLPTPLPTPTPTETGTPEKCLRRSWYGRCLEYGPDDDIDSLSNI
jgi:lipase ATG15